MKPYIHNSEKQVIVIHYIDDFDSFLNLEPAMSVLGHVEVLIINSGFFEVQVEVADTEMFADN